MKSTFKKIWDITTTVLVVLLVLCAVFLMGSRLIGYQCYTVISGSMEPEYAVGDLVYVKQVYDGDIAAITDPAQRAKAVNEKINTIQSLIERGEIKVDDAISFVLNEELTVATHRIIAIDEQNHKFYTKGDANGTEDPAVLYENLIGKVDFSIPKLGYVANFIQTSPGNYFAVGVGVVLILLVFLPDFFVKKKAATPEKVETSEEMAVALEENKRLKEEIERLREEAVKEEKE